MYTHICIHMYVCIDVYMHDITTQLCVYIYIE